MRSRKNSTVPGLPAVLTVLVASGVVLVASAPANAAVHTATYAYNGTNGTDGTVQSWVVPAGVHRASFVMKGGTGGESAYSGADGGHGALVTATIAVTPGTEMQLYVGGSGRGGGYEQGGWNGGGGYGIYTGPFAYSGGGGGATDLRTSSALESRLLVAGGGGGGGGYGNARNGDVSTYVDNIGGLGGDAGADGLEGTSTAPGYQISTAGTGGAAGCTATPIPACGAAGIGGTWTSSTWDYGVGADGNPGAVGVGGTHGHNGNAYGGYGGGGGGGYWGGGAGGSGAYNHSSDQDVWGDAGGGGGGGGSSYVSAGALASLIGTRTDLGHGSVTINWIVDSDQDLIDDEGADRCDTRPSATPDGCPDAARTLTIGYYKAKGKFFGWLNSPAAPACEAGKVVKIWKIRPGPDLLHGKATTAANGKWLLTKGFRYGRTYYATTARVLQPNVATCLAAQSQKLRFVR